MARIRRVGGALAALVLLTAGGGAASLAARQEPGQQPGCAYTPIPVDIPPDAHYPPEFSQREAREERPARSGLPTYGLEELRDPPELKSTVATEGAKQVRTYDPLEIQYTKPEETKLAGCGLRLRTYNGGLTGPTIRVKPGQTMRFKVTTEKLCEGGPCPPAPTPDYDMTNLHTHGLHVDPGSYIRDGKRIASDDVLITYRPPEEQAYEIAIPSDHTPGTHWYHAHAHGSTAIQVASGMAGALIVEDGKDSPDFPASLKNIPEKVMVFQSLFYDDKGEAIDPGKLEDRPDWQKSNRRITINGQIVPKITMRPGEVQRWRMVGALFQELLELQLADHDLNEIATDGFYLPRVDTWKPGKSVALNTGYRSDVLVKASDTEGTYILADRRTPAGVSSSPAESKQAAADPSVLNEDASVVAAVVVEKPKPPDGATPPATTGLPTDAEMQKISYDRAAGVEGPGNSLEEQWKKDPVNWNPEAPEGLQVQPAAHIQVVHFNLGQSARYADGNHFAIDHKVYPSGDVRKLTLDRIDRWELIAETGGNEPDPHLFHIHINPFQMKRAGPDGEPEKVWKDTIIVRRNISFNQNNEFTEEPLIVYTKYTVFTGKFVIHCHLLHHEDSGMMQQVELVK